jgi:two-component system chemotaxis response regulator CheY
MGKRVLIVEDSSVMRHLLTLTVQALPSVNIDEAEDGLAALKTIRAAERPYDLIFLDLNMPVMDGMKLLGFLREEPKAEGTVIAVITTEESEETEEQARGLGASYFVRKPVTRRDVEGIVTEVLGDRV